MKRYLSIVALALIAAVPLVAQSAEGWKVRADRSTSASDPDGAGEIKFMAMNGQFHAVNPQAAVYWKPGSTAMGTYTLMGTFTLNEPSDHTNYYGLVFGGSDLEGAGQSYTYFLVAQNGTYLVKKRMGDDKTENVVGKMPSDAIKKPGADGKSTNALEVRVGADTVEYVVNGTVVETTPKAGISTDGIYGIRVNHHLDVNIKDFGVRK
ncbi:MAG: hypothetical protein AB7O67_17365 [Vicinamibacterales bacterium]